jgi:hypothetical protein
MGVLQSAFVHGNLPCIKLGRPNCQFRLTDRTLIAPKRVRQRHRQILVGKAPTGHQSAKTTPVAVEQAVVSANRCSKVKNVAPSEGTKRNSLLSFPLTIIAFMVSQVLRFFLRVFLFLTVFLGVTVFLSVRRGQMWLHEIGGTARKTAITRLQRRQLSVAPITVTVKQLESSINAVSARPPVNVEEEAQEVDEETHLDEPEWDEGSDSLWNWNLGYALASFFRFDLSSWWFLLWRLGSRR